MKKATGAKATEGKKVETGMSMKAIRELAKEKGTKIMVGMNKAEAIRSIQKAEGYDDCFGKAEGGDCAQKECLFYKDCMTVSLA